MSKNRIIISTLYYDVSKDYTNKCLRFKDGQFTTAMMWHPDEQKQTVDKTSKAGINITLVKNGSYRVEREPTADDQNLVLSYIPKWN